MLRKQRRGASSAEASEAPADRMRGGTACPSCGAPLSPGSAFCPACGVRLDSAYDAAEAAARANSRKSRKRAAKEAERAAGKRAVLCTNDLAGFELMFCDGTAEVVPGVFSRTVEFGDVNYENERRDVQDAIYERMCQLHASFNAGTSYQMTLVNYPSRTVEVEAYLEEVGPTADIARSYNSVIAERQRKGRVEFDRRNFLSFATPAGSEAAAAPVLQSMEESVRSALSAMGARVTPMDGYSRAKSIADILRGPEAPFALDYGRVGQSGERVRDYVAPSWAAYPDDDRTLRRRLAMPGRVVKSYLIRDLGSDLSERTVRTIRALPIPMAISMSFRPQPRGDISRRIRRNIDVVQAEALDYQQAIARSGGDITMLPPALENRESDARDLMDWVRENDQVVSWWQGVVTVFAHTDAELSAYEAELMDQAGRWTIDLVELPLRQEEALMSALPLGVPRIDKAYRSLTTAEGAAMIPFSSDVISGDPRRSLLFGVNQVTRASLFVDPDELKSPHGWVLGITGSGKGMEVNSFLSYLLLRYPRTATDRETGKPVSPDPDAPTVFGFDFHREYVQQFARYGAAISYFGPNEGSCLNPMDIASEGGRLTLKDVRDNTDSFLALISSMMARTLEQDELSTIDRCLDRAFAPYIGTADRPILSDLYDAMREDESDKAALLADSLEMYVTGSMDSCNGATNVVDDRQANLYVMSDLGQTMQTLVMLSALQHVRKKCFENYREGRATYLLLEEVQILFDNDAAVRVLDSFFSELRKFGLHIICVTQLPARVLQHPLAARLFENSGWFVLLPMDSGNVELMAERFKLSQSQAEKIKPSASAGTGLLIADGVKVAFDNTIPKSTLVYELWNTDPGKAAKLAAAQAAEPEVDESRVDDILAQVQAMFAQGND